MKLRVLLFAIPCLALFSALCATAPFSDSTGVGKRTGRAAQQPGKFREYPGWEYNDNERKLIIDPSALGSLHISGVFSSTDVSSLLHFLRDRPGLRITETPAEIRVEKNP